MDSVTFNTNRDKTKEYATISIVVNCQYSKTIKVWNNEEDIQKGKALLMNEYVNNL